MIAEWFYRRLDKLVRFALHKYWTPVWHLKRTSLLAKIELAKSYPYKKYWPSRKTAFALNLKMI